MFSSSKMKQKYPRDDPAKNQNDPRDDRFLSASYIPIKASVGRLIFRTTLDGIPMTGSGQRAADVILDEHLQPIEHPKGK